MKKSSLEKKLFSSISTFPDAPRLYDMPVEINAKFKNERYCI